MLFIVGILICVIAQPIQLNLTPNIFQISKLNYGQKLRLIAELSGPKLPDARNVELILKIIELNKVRYFSRESYKRYILEFEIPKDKRYKQLTLKFILTADIGVPYTYTKTHVVYLTDKLNVTLIEPKYGTAELSGPLDRIKIRVRYYNYVPFDGDMLYAKVYVDGNEELVKFERIDEDGTFLAYLSRPVTPKNKELIVRLFGVYSGSSSTEIRESFWNRFILFIQIVIVVGILVFGTFFLALQRHRFKNIFKAPTSVPERPKKLVEVKLEEQEGVRKRPLLGGRVEEVIIERRPGPQMPSSSQKTPPTSALPQEQKEKEKEKKGSGLLPFYIPKKE